MPLTAWNEVRFYDVGTDTDSIMFSGFSGHGTYWRKEAACEPGKSRRAQRDRVMELISAAIERGDEPGEVKDGGVRENPTMASDEGDAEAKFW